MPEEEAGQITSSTLTRRRGLKGNNQLNEMMPKIIVALFIIVIIVVVWILLSNRSIEKCRYRCRQDEQPITMENSKPDPDQSGKATDKSRRRTGRRRTREEPEEPQQTLAFESASGETSTYGLTDAEAFKLEIRLNRRFLDWC